MNIINITPPPPINVLATALHSGYNHQLKLKPPPPKNVSTGQNRRRHRNFTWYNPPYSKNVATNIGRTFLKILDGEFPENHALHKIFNRNTVKVSYTCMTNIKQTTDGHNKAILKKDDPHHKTLDNKCNCKSPDKSLCLANASQNQLCIKQL